MTDRPLRVINMTAEQVENITADNVQSIFALAEKELERRLFLFERYSREEYLQNYLAATPEDRAKMPIIASFEKSSTDTAAGYFVGKPVTYYNKNYSTVEEKADYRNIKSSIIKIDKLKKEKEQNDFLPILTSILANNSEHLHNINLAQDSFSCTTAIEQIYVDEDETDKIKRICFGQLDPTETVTIYDMSIKPKLIAIIRKIVTQDYTAKDTKEIITYELETKKRRVAFDVANGITTTRGLAKDTKKNLVENKSGLLSQLPLCAIEYPMPERIGLFELQIPSIGEYERVQTSTKHQLKYNAHDSKLVLSGVEQPTLEDGTTIDSDKIEDTLNADVLFGGDNPEGANFAKWLAKVIDDNPIEHHKKTLKGDIFGTMGMIDPSEADAVYQNYMALQFKMYGLEQKASELEQIYRKGLLQRADIICQIYNALNNTSYSTADIGCTFERNIPLNKIEEATLMGTKWGKMHPEDIYNQMASVENSKATYENYQRFQLEEAALEAKKAIIMADATETDILPQGTTKHVVKSIEE